MPKFILSILLFTLLLAPVAVLAANNTGGAPVRLDNPLGDGKTDVPSIIGTVIKGILSVIGAVVLLMFIWGAQQWLTSAGSPEKITAGKKTMVFAALGSLIVFFSYLFLRKILEFLSG